MRRYFVTSPLGIEELVAKELNELGAYQIEVDIGKVFFSADDDFMYVGNFMLRTINRLFILLARTKFSSLRDLKDIAASIDYVEYIPPKATFAVIADRLGKHNFTSLDVKREVGAGVIKSYRDSTGKRLRVNLDKPDIEIYALVRNDEFVLGINTTGTSLHRRGYRVYNHPAALKTTLAAALVILTDLRNDEAFLDPMCGGGTVAIEAVHRIRKYPITLFRYEYAFRKLRIYDPSIEASINEALLNNVRISESPTYCVDISEKHLEGAKANALAGRVYDVMRFIRSDSIKPSTYEVIKKDVEIIKYVALNPPYGMRFHNPKKIPMFYRDFLKVISNELPGANLALITAAIKAMEWALSEVGVKVIKRLNVMHGGLPARIYLMRL